MDITDSEKKSKALAFFKTTDDPYALLNSELDDESLAYLTEQLAWGWKVDSAIIMLNHGVFATPVLSWARMYAPEKVDEILKAEFLGFRYIYEKSPNEWEEKRNEWRNHLITQVNKKGVAMYSEFEIEETLKKYGYSDNVKQNAYYANQ